MLVANQRRGSVSVIDAATRKVVAEHEIGRSLADLAMLKGGRRLLAVDGTSNELLLIDYGSRTMRVIDRLPVGAAPIRLAVLAGGRSCAVASRWSRRLTFASVVDGPSGESTKLALLGDLELPFCPRELVSLADSSKLVVAELSAAAWRWSKPMTEESTGSGRFRRTILEEWPFRPTANRF